MKTVIIIDESLPNGLAANTAAVLGISLGEAFPDIVREPAFDSAGNEYAGITSQVIPVLAASEDKLREIVQAAQSDEMLKLIPFTKIAQKSRDYDSYKEELARAVPEAVSFSGIALAGTDRKVSRMTGSLPLLR